MEHHPLTGMLEHMKMGANRTLQRQWLRSACAVLAEPLLSQTVRTDLEEFNGAT